MILLFNFATNVYFWFSFIYIILTIVLTYNFGAYVIKHFINKTFTSARKFLAFIWFFVITLLVIGATIAFGPGERKGEDVPLYENTLHQEVIKDTVNIKVYHKTDKELEIQHDDSLWELEHQKNTEELNEILQNY